jgi:hypothetical protein
MYVGCPARIAVSVKRKKILYFSLIAKLRAAVNGRLFKTDLDQFRQNLSKSQRTPRTLRKKRIGHSEVPAGRPETKVRSQVICHFLTLAPLRLPAGSWCRIRHFSFLILVKYCNTTCSQISIDKWAMRNEK